MNFNMQEIVYRDNKNKAVCSVTLCSIFKNADCVMFRVHDLYSCKTSTPLLLNFDVLCRLYIKQSPSSTSISNYDEEPEWAEYKIKETNMFTADKYQQVSSSNHSNILGSLIVLFVFSLNLRVFY